MDFSFKFKEGNLKNNLAIELLFLTIVLVNSGAIPIALFDKNLTHKALDF